jgi:hypothetical protein
MEVAAQQLSAFCDAFPELSDDLQGALAMRLPGVLSAPHAETRARLERVGELAGLGLEATARLMVKVCAYVCVWLSGSLNAGCCAGFASPRRVGWDG